jgi:hypothetical protein
MRRHPHYYVVEVRGTETSRRDDQREMPGDGWDDRGRTLEVSLGHRYEEFPLNSEDGLTFSASKSEFLKSMFHFLKRGGDQ